MVLVLTGGAHSQDDKVLARIGKSQITAKDFHKEMRMYGKGGIFKTRFGYHIVKVEKTRKSVQKEFKDVKEQLKKKVEQERTQEMVRHLQSKYGVKVNYELFRELFEKQGGNGQAKSALKP